jgi:hypothetical protein
MMGLLGCDTVWSCRWISTFRRLYPPCIIQPISHRRRLDSEGGCSICLRNIAVQPREYRCHNLKDHNLTRFTSSYTRIIVYCNVLHKLCSYTTRYRLHTCSIMSCTQLHDCMFRHLEGHHQAIYISTCISTKVLLYTYYIYNGCTVYVHVCIYFLISFFLFFFFLRSRRKKVKVKLSLRRMGEQMYRSTFS